MTALYLLTAEYRDAATKLAELDLDAQTVADTLESLGGDLELKAQNVALMARSLDADADAMLAWAKQATERAKAVQARADSLRDYLARCLDAAGIQKIDGPGVRIGWRASTAVDVFQPELLPAEYMRQKPPPAPEPDKAAIGAALKAGQDVPGARLDQRRSLQIK